MLRTPMVLGISMAPRKSRRIFVGSRMSVMLALTSTFLIVPSWRKSITGWVTSSCAFLLVCLLVFSRLVKQIGPLDVRGGGDHEPRLGPPPTGSRPTG